MDSELLYDFLRLLIQVVITVAGGYLIKYIKSKIDSEDYNRYLNLVKTIVEGVEQSFGPGNGPDKKAEAIQVIKNITKNKLSEDQVNSLIEAAVFEMNRLIKSSSAPYQIEKQK